MKSLFLVDGSALAYRSYFAFSQVDLRNSKGQPTGAIFGFAKGILKIIEEDKPEYLAVVWDSRGKTFRHEKYEAYKAHRPKMPEDLVLQLEYIERVVKSFEIPFLQKEGFEADDIIATLTKEAEQKDYTVFIVSGDKDLTQLVSDRVFLVSFNRKGDTEQLGREEVKAKFGVAPEQIRDLLALMGDSSDNVPGLPGVGKKTAKKLLDKWGSIEEMLKNIPRLGSPKVIKAFEENQEILNISKELVTLDLKVPMDFDYEKLKWEGLDLDKAGPIFEELEFTSLLRTLKKKASEEKKKSPPQKEKEEGLPEPPKAPPKKEKGETPSEPPRAEDVIPEPPLPHFQEIGSLADLKKLCSKIEKASSFSFLNSLVGENPRKGKITTTALFLEGTSYGISWNSLSAKKEEDFGSLMKRVFSSKTLKIGFDLKREGLYLKNLALDLKEPYRDLAIEGYLLDPSQGSGEQKLETLLARYLKYTGDITLEKPRQRSLFEEEDKEDGKTVALLHQLGEIFEKKIAQNPSLQELLKTVEMPLIEVLAEMEWRGIRLDTRVLQQLSGEIAKRLYSLTEEIHREAREDFNINSPKQLGVILFEKLKIQEKLGIKRIKKTKTGYSTDQSVLEDLSDHPLPKALLEYRSLNKLMTTYLEPLPKMINPETKNLHSTFHQTITATGRLSSSSPNIQNIPIRTEMGEQIRKAFVASQEDYVLLSADYSQIELRILAHFSQDENLLEAFLGGEDIHRSTAARIMNLPPEEVTSQMRSQAKAVNFGILYGMGAQRLAKSQGLSLAEAKAFIESYFEKYPKIKQYLDGIIKGAHTTGKVTTLLGRQRLLPQIQSPNPRIRAEAERMAINTPIQGTASDLIKVAMVRLHRKIQEKKLEAYLLLQIHDELLFEVSKKDLEKFQKLIRKEMEGVASLKVPLEVEIGTGKNWLEAH